MSDLKKFNMHRTHSGANPASAAAQASLPEERRLPRPLLPPAPASLPVLTPCGSRGLPATGPVFLAGRDFGSHRCVRPFPASHPEGSRPRWKAEDYSRDTQFRPL